MSFIYLASPYSHPNSAIRQARFRAAEEFTAEAIKDGQAIFSPIIHNHELALRYHLPTTMEFWWAYNSAILYSADYLWVLTLPGWQESHGVSREIAFFNSFNKQPEYKSPDGLLSLQSFRQELNVR